MVYVRPDTQRFLELNPKYFHDIDGGDDGGLEIEFRAEHNSVRVCASRASPEEIALGESRWEESGYEVGNGNKGSSCHMWAMGGGEVKIICRGWVKKSRTS